MHPGLEEGTGAAIISRAPHHASEITRQASQASPAESACVVISTSLADVAIDTEVANHQEERPGAPRLEAESIGRESNQWKR